MDWALHRIRRAIVEFASEEADLANDFLSAEEWRLLTHVNSFLRNFHDATKATEGRRATIDQVLPTMDFLIECFETEIGRFQNNEYMLASLETGLTKMLKY